MIVFLICSIIATKYVHKFLKSHIHPFKSYIKFGKNKLKNCCRYELLLIFCNYFFYFVLVYLRNIYTNFRKVAPIHSEVTLNLVEIGWAINAGMNLR